MRLTRSCRRPMSCWRSMSSISLALWAASTKPRACLSRPSSRKHRSSTSPWAICSCAVGPRITSACPLSTCRSPLIRLWPYRHCSNCVRRVAGWQRCPTFSARRAVGAAPCGPAAGVAAICAASAARTADRRFHGGGGSLGGGQKRRLGAGQQRSRRLDAALVGLGSSGLPPGQQRRAGLGYGLARPWAAVLGHRDSGKLCVNLQADGDMLFTPAALWTAAHHRLPLLVVMFNNRSYYNSEEHAIELARVRERPVARAGIGHAAGRSAGRFCADGAVLWPLWRRPD